MGIENYNFAWIKQKICNPCILKRTVAFLLKWQMLILSLCSESKAQTKLLHRLEELGQIWAAWGRYLKLSMLAGASARLLHVSRICVLSTKFDSKLLGFNQLCNSVFCIPSSAKGTQSIVLSVQIVFSSVPPQRHPVIFLTLLNRRSRQE